MKHFDAEGKGALFAVDVESYEHEVSIAAFIPTQY